MVAAQVCHQVARDLQLRRCRAATSRPRPAQHCRLVRPVDGYVDAGRILRVCVDTIGRSIRVRVVWYRHAVRVVRDADTVGMRRDTDIVCVRRDADIVRVRRYADTVRVAPIINACMNIITTTIDTDEVCSITVYSDGINYSAAANMENMLMQRSVRAGWRAAPAG